MFVVLDFLQNPQRWLTDTLPGNIALPLSIYWLVRFVESVRVCFMSLFKLVWTDFVILDPNICDLST